MVAARRPTAPPDLDKRGRAFWRDVLKIYELNVDELQLLAEACRTFDDCERLRIQIETDGVMVRGSTGQSRLHPAVAELRQHRALVGKLLAQLGLPDLDGQAASTPNSRRAAKAATARWTRAQQQAEQRKDAARGATS